MAERQIIRFLIGLVLIFALTAIDIRFWLAAAFPIYLLSLVLLLAVPVTGVEVGGAKRWLSIAGLSFQPAEFMKAALILALARYYQWLPEKRISHPLALLLPRLA